MPRYLAESYLGRRGDLRDRVQRADAAARALGVRHLRASYMPDDELCLHFFDAPSPAVVDEIGRRARIGFDRIVEAVELTERPTDQEDPWSSEPPR
jgi:hypothetical protein